MKSVEVSLAEMEAEEILQLVVLIGELITTLMITTRCNHFGVRNAFADSRIFSLKIARIFLPDKILD